jgi:hypothetical protein
MVEQEKPSTAGTGTLQAVQPAAAKATLKLPPRFVSAVIQFLYVDQTSKPGRLYRQAA